MKLEQWRYSHPERIKGEVLLFQEAIDDRRFESLAWQSKRAGIRDSNGNFFVFIKDAELRKAIFDVDRYYDREKVPRRSSE
jgi:hypothetical protein